MSRRSVAYRTVTALRNVFDGASATASGPVANSLCGIGEQERLLRDGRADVALLHRPFDSTVGLDTEELSTEGQVVVLPAGHPLAAPAQVRMADVTALPDLPPPRRPGRNGTADRVFAAGRHETRRRTVTTGG
ncbi:LysR substrate-binding domain-containing protein [Micromonospora sp. NPDC049230]|uniref:LysR substrate-binding domain-containing protein n=1 Tax=Micromonospora sp. NPDC049230 TaxID=3155502 RepID=UPI0033FD5695